jgi:hypothetical protein
VIRIESQINADPDDWNFRSGPKLSSATENRSTGLDPGTIVRLGKANLECQIQRFKMGARA